MEFISILSPTAIVAVIAAMSGFIIMVIPALLERENAKSREEINVSGIVANQVTSEGRELGDIYK